MDNETAEKTNQQLYDKLIEGFNKVFDDTFNLDKKSDKILDLMLPTHVNVGSNYNNLVAIKSKIEQIDKKLSAIQSVLDEIRREPR